MSSSYCRLPGAELIPLATVPTDAADKLPDKSAEIIVYCHHGMRSLHAVGQLRALGYANARSMAGGIDRWSREIDPGSCRGTERPSGRRAAVSLRTRASTFRRRALSAMKPVASDWL